MEVQGEGVNAEYVVGPLHWGGKATLTRVYYENGVVKYRVRLEEDPTWEEPSACFEYFTDEQMQELFLAYIALKEAMEYDTGEAVNHDA